MNAPASTGDGAARDPGPLAPEDDAGPQRDRGQEHRRRDAAGDHAAHAVDRGPRPGDRDRDGDGVDRPQHEAAGHLQRRGQQQQRADPGGGLVHEQPDHVAADQERRHAGEADDVDAPGHRPGEEIVAALAAPQHVAGDRQDRGHHRLEAERAALDEDAVHDLGRGLGLLDHRPASASRRLASVRAAALKSAASATAAGTVGGGQGRGGGVRRWRRWPRRSRSAPAPMASTSPVATRGLAITAASGAAARQSAAMAAAGRTSIR